MTVWVRLSINAGTLCRTPDELSVARLVWGIGYADFIKTVPSLRRGKLLTEDQFFTARKRFTASCILPLICILRLKVDLTEVVFSVTEGTSALTVTFSISCTDQS